MIKHIFSNNMCQGTCINQYQQLLRYFFATKAAKQVVDQALDSKLTGLDSQEENSQELINSGQQKRGKKKEPVHDGIDGYLRREIQDFETNTGLKFAELQNGVLDDIIQKRKKEVQSKIVVNQDKLAYIMKYLQNFEKEFKYWFKKDRTDFLVYNILYFGLEHLSDVQVKKDYRYVRKRQQSKKVSIDHAIQYKNKIVFLNTCASSHLIDVAIINNSYRAMDYTNKRNKEQLQFGIASDLCDLAFTCYDPSAGAYNISSTIKLFNFQQKQFQKDSIQLVLENIQALIYTY